MVERDDPILLGEGAKVAAGADLVQIYTGLIYQGPALVAQAARAMMQVHRPQ